MHKPHILHETIATVIASDKEKISAIQVRERISFMD